MPLGFISSPTIRINGVDIAGELVESACDSCSESCACNGGVDCRDWVWQGQRSQEPPVGLIVEAIMRHAGGTNPGSATPSPAGIGGGAGQPAPVLRGRGGRHPPGALTAAVSRSKPAAAAPRTRPPAAVKG